MRVCALVIAQANSEVHQPLILELDKYRERDEQRGSIQSRILVAITKAQTLMGSGRLTGKTALPADEQRWKVPKTE